MPSVRDATLSRQVDERIEIVDERGTPDDRRLRATALLMAADSSDVLPVLAVEAAGDPADRAGPWVSELASNGLTVVAGEEDALRSARGWQALVLLSGFDWFYVVVRSPDSKAFYEGRCVATDGWREQVTGIGGCVLLVGNLGLRDVRRADLTPGLVAEKMVVAGSAGALAGGLIKVFWPGETSGDLTGILPVDIGSAGPRPRVGSGPPPQAGERDAPDDQLGEALQAVRAQARGLSRDDVRRRLVEELFRRGEMLPSRVADYYTDDVLLGDDMAGRTRRWARRQLSVTTAGWHALRSVGAMARHRPPPHWHAMGIHRVTPSQKGQRLEIVLDSGAEKWLAVGEADAIDVWLGPADRGTPEPAPNAPVVVYRGDERVGLLGTDADAAYRPVLTEASHAGAVVVATAIRSRTADGSWRLRLGHPAQGLDGLLGRLTR
jgi:hypothetical protein